VPAQTQRRRRPSSGADPERFEVCDVGHGRRRARVVATGETLGSARLAVKTLTEEAGRDGVVLAIRDTATGRWIAR